MTTDYPPPKVFITKHSIKRMRERFADVLDFTDSDAKITAGLRRVVVSGIKRGRFFNGGILFDFRGKPGIARAAFDPNNNEWRVCTVIDWSNISMRNGVCDDPCGILKSLILQQEKRRTQRE